MSAGSETNCRVRLTDDAVADLYRLQKTDPQMVRDVFAKMVLLERSTNAGDPLVGALVGFRKLVLGDRHLRIIWRETTDESYQPVLDIAEVWAAGVREDSEVYDEMKQRVETLKTQQSPMARPLNEIVQQLGRLYSSIPVHPEPPKPAPIPNWLQQGLKDELHLTDDQIADLSEDDAQQLMVDYWSRKK